MDTFNHLQVGDPIIINGPRYLEIGKVIRVTDKQVQVGGCMYWKKNGKRVGYAYGASLMKWDQETADEIGQEAEKRKLVAFLGDVSWRTLPLETLRAVKNLLTPADPMAEVCTTTR